MFQVYWFPRNCLAQAAYLGYEIGMSGRVYVIGAGIAGLSAACEAVRAGFDVTVLESAKQAGGRCRSYEDPVLNTTINNGNHLLLKGNRNTLEWIETIGATEYFKLYKPFTYLMQHEDGRTFQLKADSFKPLSIKEAAMFVKDLLAVNSKQGNVQDVLGKSPLWETFWRNITTSVCNTKPQQIPSRIVKNTLKNLFLAGKDGLLPFLPTENWQTSLIDPAIAYIQGNSAEITLKTRVKSIETSGNAILNLETADEAIVLGKNDKVVLAVPAQAAHELVPDLVPAFEHCAIINGHFKVTGALDLSDGMPFRGLNGYFAEWLFYHDGMISTTTSAADEWSQQDNEVLAKHLWDDIRSIHPTLASTLPEHRVVIEKRATIACTEENLNKRPVTETKYSNLYLAGDYTNTELPATIEGAVLSGKKAIQAIQA